MTRVSWRKVQAGMRLYDPPRGNPLIMAIVPTTAKTRRTLGHPAAMATDADWRFSPKGGFVKLVSAELEVPGA